MDTNEVHTNIEPLIEILQSANKNYDIEKITNAFQYAKELHEGQFRASGEPYISHPIAVAEIAAGLGLDTDSICATLLHDTLEDCGDKTSITEIENRFGKVVAMLVDGLTKIVMFRVEDKEEQQMENIRKMLLAMSNDVRVIFIKLCDRLHNMRTLDAKPENKRRITALETMHVYAPLAHRLGIQKIKQELENLSLKYLDPIGYQDVQTHIDEKYGQNLHLIENIQKDVGDLLTANNIHFTLEGRIKSVYSIYNKMFNHSKQFDQIYDFYALRIIVDTELECYTALGLIHEKYNSMPGRFKDYISTPKSNMYRSLHTTVMGTGCVPFEVQIRTWEMHHIAEYGIAAHWKYKSGATSKEEMDKKLEWIAKLLETEEDQRDPDEFMDALKTDMFQEDVFVFTPKGDVISLPSGSNIIDFAFAIHSKVGERMVGGKINGNIVPIDRVLENGEIVEIITSSATKGPSRDWLNIAHTTSARQKIRSWFKKEKRPENIAVGKNDLDVEIKRIWKGITEAQKNDVIQELAERLGFSNSDDFFNEIGYGGLMISKIAKRLGDICEKHMHIDDEETNTATPEVIPISKPNTNKRIKSNSGIIIDGESGCLVKFAKCCNPLPGDSVVGFVTKGYGISVHKTDCPNCIESRKNPENASRWKDAHWEQTEISEKSHSVYEATLQIFSEDRIGMLADISTALADMKVSILQVNVTKKNDDRTIVSMKIGCRNVDHYFSIVSRLRALKGVNDVIRGFSNT